MKTDGQTEVPASEPAGAGVKPPAQAVGTILRRARERRGLSLEQAATAARVGVHTLAAWEGGIWFPRLDSLARLAGEIGLDIGDLAPAMAPPAPSQHRGHRFGAIFQAARQRRRLSVTAVARVVGVSAATLQRWEEGGGLPQNRWLPRLARRLGLHLGELDEFLGAAAAPELPETEDEGDSEVEKLKPPRPTTAALGALVRSRRELMGLSRPAVAKRAGIEAQSLVRYEKGLGAPTVESLGRLVWVLDLDLGDFEAVLSPWAAARRRWEHVGLALRLVRERRGWTREELAEKAGLRAGLVQGFEERPESGSLRTLGRLVDALGVALGELDELFDPEVPRAERFEKIGRLLRAVRERRGVQRDELARRTGIGLSLIGRWEAGGVPRMIDFGLAAAVLELDLGDLGAALDDAAAWVRVEHAVAVDAHVRRVARELLAGDRPSLERERLFAIVLAALHGLRRTSDESTAGTRITKGGASPEAVAGGG